jgi:hypothetical protein
MIQWDIGLRVKGIEFLIDPVGALLTVHGGVCSSLRIVWLPVFDGMLGRGMIEARREQAVA